MFRILSVIYFRDVNPGVGVATPRFWAGGSWGLEILLYLIVYRKYVRKWWLLKRNRIIWPEAAVNGQFCPENRIFFVKLPEKSIFFGNLPGKIEFFLPGSTTPRFQTRSVAALGFFIRGCHGEAEKPNGRPIAKLCRN